MLKILLNTLLGIVLIFVWSRFVDLNQIFKTISTVKIEYLIPVAFFMLLSPVIRAIRLKIFLSEIKKIALKDLIFLNGVAMMLNFFIPIRAGEIAKGIFLNTNYKIDLKKGVIWIFIDRFVDFLAVLLFTGLLLSLLPHNLGPKFSLVVTFVFLIALFITYISVFQLSFTKRLVRFFRPFLIFKKLQGFFDSITTFVLDSFSILDRHPKDLSLMIVLTILAYGADAGIWYFTFISLGSNQDFLKMFLGQLLSGLTYLIPAAPGYVGSAEASGLLILSGIFSINSNLASAMIVLFHILSALFVLIFGLISLFNLKINLGVILNKALKRK
jgi:uncharacterized protein (TIRG00374 family)